MSLSILLLLLLAAHTTNASWVRVEKGCYNTGEAIVVRFNNQGDFLRMPQPTDYIAIYEFGSVDMQNLPSTNRAPLWVRLCGTQRCGQVMNEGAVLFMRDAGPRSVNHWPIAPGRYIAVLSGTGGPIFQGLFPSGQAWAVSSSFFVQPSCSGGRAPPITITPQRPPSPFVPLPTTTPPPTPEPTMQPTRRPTLRPTRRPTPSPTRDPTTSPTFKPTGLRPPPATDPPTPSPTDEPTPTSPTETTPTTLSEIGDAQMFEVVEAARKDIAALIEQDVSLGAKFLRLAFHDCVGGCDGCVDFTNPDNAGLGIPISSLIPIVNKYASQGLTRPDIWTLSASVASQELQPQNRDTLVPFDFNWIGRKTCAELSSTPGRCGTNFLGRPASCSALAGPHHELCHGDAGTDNVLDFFLEEFSMNPKQVVAIMGAHTVGQMQRRALGFEGENGWDLTNTRFDNGYMIELAGFPDETEADLPDWKVVMVDNRDLTDIPDRPQWEASVEDGTKTISMLNPDMALVRQVDDGQVKCTFKAGQNRCPDALQTIRHVKEYADDNTLFLQDFRDALDIVLENGYTRTSTGECPHGRVCRLAAPARRN